MDIVFWIAACAGTLFFSLKLLLSFLGAGVEDVDQFEIVDDHVEHGSDNAFKILSIHSLTGFLMMFGWVGLACSKQYDFSLSLSILCAFIVGILMMVVTGALFKLASCLISTGSRFRVEDLVSLRGKVYQKIPSEGVGKIQIIVNGYQREIRALSELKQEIASFTEVEVIKAFDKNTVLVKAIQNTKQEL